MSAPSQTFLWYDYETSGLNFVRDRIMQFGAVRTDAELRLIDKDNEPLNFCCRPSRDFLPSPEACLLTGVTPQKAEREGLPEPAFSARLHEEFSRGNSCAVGYNNMRFDRHFTRHLFHRNLYDPYAHEWRDGNSSWDLINVMRLCRALRPEGINWPDNEEGEADFRLEALGAANLDVELRSHDALADARTTLELARLLREKQPRLFDYALGLRSASSAAEKLPLSPREPMLHIDSVYGNRRGCAALALPLCRAPGRGKHAVAVYDLSCDARALLESDGGAGQRPPGLHLLQLNQCPLFAPAKMLDDAAAERLGIDRGFCEEQFRILSEAPELERRALSFWPEQEEGGTPPDPEFLYGGGFLSDRDRRLLEKARATPPERLGRMRFDFEDPRPAELLFRWRARNFPGTLSEEETQRWEEFRYRRLTEAEDEESVTLDRYLATLERLQQSPEIVGDAALRAILEDLQDWADIVTA